MQVWAGSRARGRFFAVVALGAFLLLAVAPARTQQAVAGCGGDTTPTGKTTAAPTKQTTFAYDGATLNIGSGAVSTNTTIGIGPLNPTQLATLDPGVTDVTLGPRCGYSFTPHYMHFNKAIQVTIPYDPTLIPAGLSANDIRTYYFDDQAGDWQQLDRVSIDTTKHTITSSSDHFTDMINGTLVAPDHAQPLAYDPNSIRGLKAADPGTSIAQIKPPTANNRGDAKLSYPIELPDGRNGIQPSLDISYDSAKSDSWLGIGWDLQPPTLSVDTRWGVPRYDAADETESYLLNGDELTPIARTSPLVARTAEKTFHLRVEGAFYKIVRHGDTPSTYWWEVIDKGGTHSFYGAAGGAVDPTSSLSAPGGVFRWALRKEVDPYGNTVEYHYEHAHDPVVAGGSLLGDQLYLKSIEYTGFNGTPGPYTVTFLRDANVRPDVFSDVRAGSPVVTADRLTRIEVRFNGSLVRSYDFQYDIGAYNKSLLTSITQSGKNGTEFNKHTFHYYNEATDSNGAYNGFGSAKSWGAGSDNVESSAPELPGAADANKASALSGAESNSDDGHLYIGFNPADPDKEFSFGGKLGFQSSRTESDLTLVDLNGDGLPDKAFNDGSGNFFFRLNTSGAHPTAACAQSGSCFGDAQAVDTLPGLANEHSFTFSGGAEAYVGIGGVGVSVVFNHAETFTVGDLYFEDVNDDGLPDIVKDGQVHFNHVVNGVPTFSDLSTGTRNPITQGTVDSSDILADFDALYQKELDEFPLQDTLRRWVAPFNGTIKISGPVSLDANSVDGVRVAIQDNAGELWSANLQPGGATTPDANAVGSINVTVGERIYFRVGSILDGRHDKVSWNPKIQYLDGGNNPLSHSDVNGLDDFQYQPSDDFTLAGRAGINTKVPFEGVMRVKGDFKKLGVTTDDVKLQFLKNNVVTFSQTLTWNQANATIPLAESDASHDIAVAKGDTITLRVVADSPIDVTKLQWSPTLFYVSTTDPAAPALDGSGNFLITFRPPYDINLYPQTRLSNGQPVGSTQDAYVAPKDETLTVKPTITYNAVQDGPATGTVIVTVKRPGARLGKESFSVGQGTTNGPAFDVDLEKGDVVYFDFSAKDPIFGAGLSSPKVVANANDGNGDFNVPSALHVPFPIDTKDNPGLDPANTLGNGLWAEPFRGWAAAGYNGNGGENGAIDESKLVFDQDQYSNKNFNPTLAGSYLYYPDTKNGLWSGPTTGDDGNGAILPETWVSPGGMSSSRVGADHIDVPHTGDVAGAGASAVNRLSHGSQNALSGGVSFASASTSGGSSDGGVDFKDMNGDGYPDVIGNGSIQFTTPLGSLEASAESVSGVDPVRNSGTTANGFSTGGTVPLNKSDSSGEETAPGDSTPKDNKDGVLMATLGFSAGIGNADSNTESELADMNGDGLPDRVTAGSGQLTVAFNLGYGFSQPQTWGTGDVNTGHSDNQSLGISIGFNADSVYGFAGGANLSQSQDQSKATLIDVNGDGLTDYVTRDGNGNMSVAFNLGNGFALPKLWPGAIGDSASSSSSHSEGLGVYFTIGIGPLCLAACYLIINPGYDHVFSMARELTALRDVNGDGYTDMATSGPDDSNIQAALNPTGDTNLLKSIDRPLGSKITIEYERDGNTFDDPDSRYVMSKTTVDDGHSGDGDDKLVTTYSYEGGKKSFVERDFFGYAKVTENLLDAGNNVYRSIVRTYSNDNYYDQGLLTSDVTQDGAGNKFLETDNTYFLRDVNTGTQLADPSSRTATAFAELRRTDKLYFEGQAVPGKTTKLTYAYDAFGNTTNATDDGDPGPADDDSAIVTYADCPGTYIENVPNKIVVTSGATELRHREGNVDCSNGNVTQLREYVTPASAAVTDLVYDQFGNLTHFTGPQNLHGQRYELDYTYDPDVKTYVTGIVNSFGYSSSSVYDPSFGVMLSSTDTNNNKTTYTYDEFGRVSSITGPFEQGGPTATVRYEYHPDASTPWALTRNLDPFRGSGATIDNVTFVDGLDRLVQSKKSATVYNEGTGSAEDVMVVSGQTTFDFAGRTIEQFYPRTEPLGTPGTFNPLYDGVTPTKTTYDVLDRVTSITTPDSAVVSHSRAFGPDRFGDTEFVDTKTDADGNKEKTFTNVRQLTTSVERFLTTNGGSQPVWKSYTYDPLQKLVSSTDDKNNVTHLTYDNLGRQTSIDNPDTGRVDTVYDLASNAIARITANLRAENRQINYDFDFSRLKSITYPDFPDNNVTYTYGAPGAPNNAAGRVTQVTYEAGSTKRSYDKLGQVTQEDETIFKKNNGKGPNATDSYTTKYVYDTWGRMQNVTYPDGELLTYRYDSGGLVSGVSGVKLGNSYDYVDRYEYDKFGQAAFEKFGNGTTTHFSYRTDNRRLSNLQSKTPTGTMFQNLDYSYDPVGNVLGEANDVAVPPPSQMGGPTTQIFGYDSLYRLTNASGSYAFAPDKTRQYTSSFTYDTVDDLLTKSQADSITQPGGTTVPQKKTSYDFTYQYGGPQPNAPTHIGIRTYTYDADGNQTGWTNDKNGTRRTITWDEEDRVQQIADNGHKMNYLYDDTGNRIVTYGSQGQVAYVNPFFTIRNSAVGTKHVWLGATRVVSKLMKNPATGDPAPLEKAEYFFHPDRLGSTSYVTQENGDVYQHLEYFPFGESWIEEKSNTNNTPYLYSAKLLDDVTDLYYYGARYYDPRTSVWQSADPLQVSDPQKALSVAESPDLYGYAQENPVTYTDPDGRDIIIAMGNEPPGHGNSYIKEIAKKLETSLKGSIGAEHVKLVAFKDIATTVAKIKADGHSVSGFVYVGHGTQDSGGELIPNVPGAAPDKKYVKIGDVAAMAGVSDQGAVAIIGCRVLGGKDAGKATTAAQQKGIRLIGSTNYFYTDSSGQVGTNGAEVPPDQYKGGYKDPDKLKIGYDLQDPTGLSPKAQENPDPFGETKYQTLGEALVGAEKRVTPPPPPKAQK